MKRSIVRTALALLCAFPFVSRAALAASAAWIAEDLPPGIKAKSEKNCIRMTCAPGYSDDFFEYGWRRIAEYLKKA